MHTQTKVKTYVCISEAGNDIYVFSNVKKILDKFYAKHKGCPNPLSILNIALKLAKNIQY